MIPFSAIGVLLTAISLLLIAYWIEVLRDNIQLLYETRERLRMLDENLDSHDRLEAERFEELKNPADPPETVCGYPLQELVLFAQACRQNGVENQDLVSFAHDIVVIRDMVRRDLQEAAEKAITAGQIRCQDCDAKKEAGKA